MRKAKMGRPPIAAKNRRTSVLSVRLTAAERRLIDAAAGHEKASDWARRVLLAEVTRSS